jgi:hypothetical protein
MGDKEGYAVVKEEHTIKKRILPPNTVFSAEQSAIIEAIQSEKNNIRNNNNNWLPKHDNSSWKPHTKKEPQTQTIRMMLDHEGPRITSHVGIPGNEKADQVAKEALDEDISTRQTTWRNGWPKRISKRETKDGKTETTRWKKGSRTSTEKSKWQYPDSEPGIRGPPTASKWKVSAINYAPSATPFYLSTTYCGNAKKLRTREWTWTWERNNGSTGKKVWKR